eukprot:CAMPEP_0172765324 /NCGR_PEP_ID=MMETSP1074-20121228/179057_1 /TAXON_ID=2916 /ORGANISM="Ceratium fusus, Strain PA161109" /LENGTH=47 /DNA_ID= /DNA_START= /DNA_END= /DNA_ORIENTATION=
MIGIMAGTATLEEAEIAGCTVAANAGSKAAAMLASFGSGILSSSNTE